MTPAEVPSRRRDARVFRERRAGDRDSETRARKGPSFLGDHRGGVAADGERRRVRSFIRDIHPIIHPSIHRLIDLIDFDRSVTTRSLVASSERRDRGMLLVKLWIAKKLAVLLAVRAFGVKRLYRKGLRLSKFAHGDARTTVRTNGEWMMRKTCQTAMKTEQWFVRKATAFTERAFESAGFTRRGMPSAGGARAC